MTDTHHPPIGLEALRAALKTVPGTPGIYKMIDGAGKILYIGKAKNLINRVTSYTNINNLNNRIMRMVAQIATVEVITTKNEAEALLVEASLIKRHMPRYNVLLKDDKSFPYIRIDTTHPFPRIEKHRGGTEQTRGIFRALRECAGAQCHHGAAAKDIPAAPLCRQYL
jgi:excinuclease ABC subunit C